MRTNNAEKLEETKMLLAHGTTEKKADEIYSSGYFHVPTYFLKLDCDFKLGLFGTAPFGLRHHEDAWKYFDFYCRQDLVMFPFASLLKKEGLHYLSTRVEDRSPGLVF